MQYLTTVLRGAGPAHNRMSYSHSQFSYQYNKLRVHDQQESFDNNLAERPIECAVLGIRVPL